MDEIVYTATGEPPQKVYRDGWQVVMRIGAILPQVCIGCGSPTAGRVLRREFSKEKIWSHLGSLGYVLDFFLRESYIFDFPYCRYCIVADRFSARTIRLDKYLAVFENIAILFLDSLPVLPPDVAAEKRRTWIERELRWLFR